MSRFIVFLTLALLCVATAFQFRTPARLGGVASKTISSRTNLNMAPAEFAVQATSSIMSQFSQVLAAESDFGGYAGPAGSLLLIAFLILTLAPPLAQKDQD